MKKLILPLGILGVFLLLKNNNKNQLPGSSTASNTTAVTNKINELFADNSIKLRADVLEQINAELQKLSAENLQTLFTYFDNVLNGVSTVKIDAIVDTILVKMPVLRQQLATALQGKTLEVGMAAKIRLDPIITALGVFAPEIGVIYGAAKLIANLFCGKRCKARRAIEAGTLVEA